MSPAGSRHYTSPKLARDVHAPAPRDRRLSKDAARTTRLLIGANLGFLIGREIESHAGISGQSSFAR